MADVRHGLQEPAFASASGGFTRKNRGGLGCHEEGRGNDRPRAPQAEACDEEGASASLSLRVQTAWQAVPRDRHLREEVRESSGAAECPQGCAPPPALTM